MLRETGLGHPETAKPTHSVVIPFLNEAETLRLLHQRVDGEMQRAVASHEIIFVNDGSTDGSETICRQLAEANSNVVLINFRRNFGKSAALSAGFRAARGDVIITMDADLQDEPAELPSFVKAIDDGADVVSGWKKLRHDSVWKTLPSKLFNKVVSAVFRLKLQDHNCGFKAYRAEALSNLNLYGELHRFIPALLQARGFRIVELPVRHRAREFGVSKFGAGRLIKGGLDLLTVTLMTRYAARPLHIFGTLGLAMLLIGGSALTYLAGIWLLGAGPIGNRPLLFFGMLFMLFGGQLISTGLVAELVLARSIREDGKYDIRDVVGMDPEASRDDANRDDPWNRLRRLAR